MISRLMKDSGIKWVGKVPQNWVVNKVRYFMAEKSIKNHPDEMVLSLYRDYGIVPKDSRDDNHNVTSLNTSTYKLVEKNQLVINKMKAWQGSLAISKHRGIVSPAYYIFDIVKDNLLPEFLHYAFRNSAYIDEYKRLSTGIRPGQWDLNKDQFKNISYSYPVSLHEQQKIASFLDEKVAHIDSILEDTKKSIEYLKAYKQSLITETVTKGLNANVEMKDSGIEWIGEIPKHWQTVKMKRLGYVRNGLTYKPSDIVDSSEGIMVLRSGNIQDSRLSFENNVYVNKEIKDELKVNAGDILICSRNGSRNLIGKNALIENDLEATFGAFMMLFKPIANSSYIYYILNSEVFNFYLGTFLTTTINQLTKSNFESMIVVFTPDEKEQLEIASYLKKNVENLNSIIDEKNKILMELKAYKKSLIYEYVTGKKEVQ